MSLSRGQHFVYVWQAGRIVPGSLGQKMHEIAGFLQIGYYAKDVKVVL